VKSSTNFARHGTACHKTAVPSSRAAVQSAKLCSRDFGLPWFFDLSVPPEKMLAAIPEQQAGNASRFSGQRHRSSPVTTCCPDRAITRFARTRAGTMPAPWFARCGPTATLRAPAKSTYWTRMILRLRNDWESWDFGNEIDSARVLARP
jgi:hypothetical protein